MRAEQFRELFPELQEKVYGKQLVYLDSAATSLRPESVIEKWSELAEKKTSNIHRAVHRIANEATKEYENARERVRKFLNARDRKEIIFTSGATAALNLVAYSFAERFIGEGDEVLVSIGEHHSNLVPWQIVCERKHSSVKFLDIEDDGSIDLQKFSDAISERTKIVAVNHISNVLGIVNPIKTLTEIAHSKGAAILIDGSQGIIHQPIDFQDIGCDFYVFSGHKIFSSTGVGVLCGTIDFLEQMPPFMGGGEMIGTVTIEGTTYADLPYKFEAGTPNYTGVPTLMPALDLLEEAMESEEIRNEQEKILNYMDKGLKSIDGLVLLGTSEPKIPLYSFYVKGVHHEDMALILDKMGIAVRSGHMCAEPLMKRFGVEGVLRASFGYYNTLSEAEYFIASLKKAVSMLK